MPDIRDINTVQALARGFIDNKRDRSKGAQFAGYSKKTAYSGHVAILYARDDVKRAIHEIEARQAEIGNRSISGLDQMYQEGFDVAKTQRNPSGMATNTTGIARLYNMDQPEGKADQPASITEEQAARYRDMADAATADNLSKPKLSKGA